MPTAKAIANKKTDQLLGSKLDREQFPHAVEEVIGLYNEIIKNDPNDFEAKFDLVYLKAYLFKFAVDKHKEVLRILSEYTPVFIKELTDSEMTTQEKANILADVSVKFERIIADFVEPTLATYNISQMLGVGIAKNDPNAKNWNLYEVFKDTFTKLSNDLAEHSLLFAAKVISAIDGVDVKNKYACVVHIAKRTVYEMLHAPALVYDKKFYDTYSGMLKSMIGVVKSAAPHEVYLIPEPDYSRVTAIDDFLNCLLADYGCSDLREYITCTNELAKTEAIQRYWKNNPGKKESLEAEKNSLEKECADCEALCNENRRIIQKAAATRDRTLAPGKKKIADIERELKGLETELSGLNIFQGKRKKEIRSIIEIKTAELTEAKKAYELLKKDAEAAYVEATTSPKKVVNECESKLKATGKRLKTISEKLENPLND